MIEYMEFAGVAAFVALEIKEAWDVLEIVYHPIRALEEDAAEVLIKPLRKGLIQIDLVLGLVILLVVASDTISIFITGFTGFHLAVYLIVLILGALMIGISAGIYFLIKWLLILLIDHLFKKLDKKFHISETFKDFYDKVRSEEIEIDIIAD